MSILQQAYSDPNFPHYSLTKWGVSGRRSAELGENEERGQIEIYDHTDVGLRGTEEP